MDSSGIVLLATASDTTNMVYNGLGLKIDRVILEQRQSEWELVRRRAKKLGLIRVAGQLLFRATAVPLIAVTARKRQAEITKQFSLDAAPIRTDQIVTVRSANDVETGALLTKLEPKVVIVKGTRILARNLLNATPAHFVNMHTGITPRYRGVYGAYWSLVEKRPELCGVTIHLVDAGIDTGNVLAQGRIAPTPQDNILTYPYLQIAAGLPLLRDSIAQLLEGRIMTGAPLDNASKLWSHPTLWEYLGHRLTHHVK